MSYVKLDQRLLTSALWIEGDAETVMVWVYLMLQAGPDGIVHDTLPAIAHGCKLSIPKVSGILDMLSSPDEYSRTAAEDGRRIRIEREPEFQVVLINFAKYRGKDHTAAERKRRQREREDVTRDTVTRRDVTPSVTQAEAEAEAEAKVIPDGDGVSNAVELPRVENHPHPHQREKAQRRKHAEELAKSKPQPAPSQGFYWDEENRCIWATEKERSELRKCWLDFGMTTEEFKEAMRKLNRRIATKQEAIPLDPGARLNQFLTNYLQNLERSERAESSPTKS